MIGMFRACARSSPQAFPSPSLERPGNEASACHEIPPLCHSAPLVVEGHSSTSSPRPTSSVSTIVHDDETGHNGCT